MRFKDYLFPFLAWKNLFKEPKSVKDPLNVPGSARYRGFHQNDIDKCIGCGSCEEICQNATIDMVPVEGHETKHGDSGLRPLFDYGRCCWCALCVDVCATGSLTMSNEYTWVETDGDNFRYIPGFDKKPWDDNELGYKTPELYDLKVLSRIEMEELAPDDRKSSFVEIVKGYSKEQAMKEADRCLACGLCTATCPAHMRIPDYIRAIRNDDMEEGLRVLYETNPLPEICGRICTHKCEDSCALNHQGDPISIRWLKRYIADQIPKEEYKNIVGLTQPDRKEKVAVIGAGPAGLSAAYYLSRMGYPVTIFEALEEPGGMMRYGIPEYRLPYDQLGKDIDFIRAQGVEIKCNTVVGKDITLQKLHEEYDAVFSATGLQLGRSTRIPGSDHEHVFQSIDLLRKVTQGEEILVTEKIVVIGGGNVAMDISRTLARIQNKKFGRVNLTLTCLESEDKMPADLEEIVEAREEGVKIMPGWAPQSVEIKDGKVKGLNVTRCLSVFDDEGKFNPQLDENDKALYEGTMIIESIGQGMDLSYLDDPVRKHLKFGARGRIVVNDKFQSDLPWLFVGGDIIQGPDVIHGIANGHIAARGIDKFLNPGSGECDGK